MPLIETTYTLRGNSRLDIRREVVDLFLKENPGTGTGENSSKYWYIVEELDKYSILLKRPVPLNKGFDFTVNITGMFFKKQRRYSNPSHSDIIEALTYLRDVDSSGYATAIKALSEIYSCQAYDRESVRNLYFVDYDKNSHPIEIILLATKWLFVEQDVHYWNWSGRAMLWSTLSNI